jgi:hypothetical protein
MRSWELLSSWDLGMVGVRDVKERYFCCERWLEVWVKEHAIQTLGFCHMCLCAGPRWGLKLVSDCEIFEGSCLILGFVSAEEC